MNEYMVISTNPFTKETRVLTTFDNYGDAYEYCDRREWEEQDLFGTWWQLDVAKCGNLDK